MSPLFEKTWKIIVTLSSFSFLRYSFRLLRSCFAILLNLKFLEFGIKLRVEQPCSCHIGKYFDKWRSFAIHHPTRTTSTLCLPFPRWNCACCRPVVSPCPTIFVKNSSVSCGIGHRKENNVHSQQKPYDVRFLNEVILSFRIVFINQFNIWSAKTTFAFNIKKHHHTSNLLLLLFKIKNNIIIIIPS